MILSDVKRAAHNQIDGLDGQILGIVQMMIDDRGHVAVCVGGLPDAIVKIIAEAMNNNPQVKDLFEAAWCEATDTGLDLSIN